MSTASGQAHIRPAPARHEVGQGGPTPLGLGPLRNWHLLARLARVLGLDALVRVAVAGALLLAMTLTDVGPGPAPARAIDVLNAYPFEVVYFDAQIRRSSPDRPHPCRLKLPAYGGDRIDGTTNPEIDAFIDATLDLPGTTYVDDDSDDTALSESPIWGYARASRRGGAAGQSVVHVHA